MRSYQDLLVNKHSVKFSVLLETLILLFVTMGTSSYFSSLIYCSLLRILLSPLVPLLNGKGKSGHPCIILSNTWKTWSFPLLSIWYERWNFLKLWDFLRCFLPDWGSYLLFHICWQLCQNVFLVSVKVIIRCFFVCFTFCYVVDLSWFV